MKSVLFLVAVICFSLALAEVGEKCSKNDDCGEGECCMRISLFGSAKCKKLRDEGQFCLPSEVLDNSKSEYRFMCPCKEGLECKAGKTSEENGVKIVVNAKCVVKTSE